jgi:hypothetical protein
MCLGKICSSHCPSSSLIEHQGGAVFQQRAKGCNLTDWRYPPFYCGLEMVASVLRGQENVQRFPKMDRHRDV